MTRVAIEGADTEGRAVAIEFSVRPETVEVWVGHHYRALLGRARFRSWLMAPYGVVSAKPVHFGVTDTGVALMVEAIVPWWELSPNDLERLRGQI